MSQTTSCTTGVPLVSVIVLCRNEEQRIEACLNTLIASDYSKERLEILVVDGMSEDRSRWIVEQIASKFPFVRLVDNPRKIIPAACNIGTREARGEIIMVVGAHAQYSSDYIRKCVDALIRYRACNAGGTWRILPGDESVTAKAIASALAHPFASGNAYVKVGANEPRWSDSAAFGCWKKEELEKIGGWNERLAGSSDMDLNARLKQAGGKILLDPDIKVGYYADSNFRSYWKHNFADGVWATYVLKFGSKAWSWRHWVPMVFLLSLLTTAALSFVLPIFKVVFVAVLSCYLFASVVSSIQLSARERNAKFLLLLPYTFGIRHLAHGAGALYGACLLAVPGERQIGRRGPRS
jgi:glycosyltransferase involved in cell wall biosynthesis